MADNGFPRQNGLFPMADSVSPMADSVSPMAERVGPQGGPERAIAKEHKKRAAQWAALLPKSSKAEAYFTIEICCWVYSSPLRTLME
ncbi:MAG: hypothetical protein JWP58_1907 [Hymenobacter sp.]|nr:hypothetical protein [Hymenobacter sp.]